MVFTKEQTKFIKNTLGYDFLPGVEVELPDEKKRRIFDHSVEVEIETSNVGDDEEISPEGETAASLVTMLGGH